MCIYDEENVMEIKTLITNLIMIEYHSSNKRYVLFVSNNRSNYGTHYNYTYFFTELSAAQIKTNFFLPSTLKTGNSKI